MLFQPKLKFVVKAKKPKNLTSYHKNWTNTLAYFAGAIRKEAKKV
jgi:hypothetical protein